MNTETITEKLHAASDQALNRRLDNFFDSVKSECSNSHPYTMQIGEVTVNSYAAIKALRKLAFDNQVKRERQNAVDAFMSKVESLGSEIDDPRNRIN